MNSTKTSFLFNGSILMKHLHQHISSLGDFYKKHRKLLVGIKVFLVIIIGTMMFTVWSDNGHGTRHGTAQTFAEGQCGNGSCDITTAKCSMSTTDCSKIDTSTCPGIGGCFLKDGPMTYVCDGRFDPCTKLTAADCSTSTTCTLDADNKCTSPATTRKSCKDFATTDQCTSQSTCSRKGMTSQTCQGTVQPPKNDVDCNILSAKLKSFGFSITRYPEYIETETSCPTDCSSANTCGNAICEQGSGSCTLDTYNCSNFPATDATCSAINGCTIKTQYVFDSCEGGDLTCSSITDENVCTKINCAWDANTTGNKCSSLYKDGENMSTCSALGSEASCKLATDNGMGCSIKMTSNKTCGGTIQQPSDETGCASLKQIITPLGFSATRNAGYTETSNSCPDDCGTPITPTCNGILKEVTDCNQLDSNIISDAYYVYKDANGNSSYVQCIYDGTIKKYIKDVTCIAPAVCGNGAPEENEVCDDGDNNGKAGYCNQTCDGYIAADNTCGNGKCESSSACTLSATECSRIKNMTICPTVAGCSTKENVTSTCVGEFSCTALGNKAACNEFSCNWSSENKCVDVYKDGKKTSGLCSSFSSVLCKTLTDNLGLCSQSTKTTTVCDGTITTPTNDVNCLILDSIGKSFGIFAERKTYTETSDSCPYDCKSSTTPNCNGVFKPVTECSQLSSTVCSSAYYTYKGSDGVSSYIQCNYDATAGKCVKGATCKVAAICGNGIKEEKEVCDNGVNNGKPGQCNTSCNGYVKESTCGNFVVDPGEVCDNGSLLNGKPGQCNPSCNGWTSYNGYCGDGMCKSSCSIDSTLTCASLNKNNDTKALCSTLGCSLQYRDTSTCQGTVSCKDITPEKFWNSIEGAHKYCDIAGCNRNNTTNLCGLPSTQKSPSCNDLGKNIGITTNTMEYCSREPGCTLYTGTIETKCIGTTPPRADKLDQNQCATVKGTWASESISSCNSDCKSFCSPTSTTITHADGSLTKRKCNELSLLECTKYYNPERNNNCVLKGGTDGKEYCVEDTYTCTTCGNGICDAGETESSCSQDCLTDQDWPKVLYSSYPTADGKLIKGPVQASVYLPPSKGCKIINNNGEGSYNFKYNGYYVFQVMCPWFSKPWDLMAKVYWLNTNTITAVNAKDMISTSGGSVIYYENKDNFVDTISTESSMVAAAKKAVYEQTLITTLPNAATKSNLTQVITTDKNVSFENDSNVYQKISLEKTMSDTTKSTQKVQLTIPDAVTLYTDESGKKTEFSGVFVAPTAVTGKILTTASQEIQNLDTVIKAGTDKELIAVNSGNSTVSFEITVWTKATLGSILPIYMSQDGTTWTYYTGVLVEPCASNSGVQRGVNCTTFEVPHLTYYGITTNVSDTEDDDVGGNTGGGNGGDNNDNIPATNICTLDRNCKDTSLIALCGACSGTVPTLPATGTTITITPENEQLIAYQYAFLHNITTMPYERARLGDSVTRGELAKMIVNFAKNVLEKKPDTKKVCAFSDNIYGSKEDKSFIIQACQLGLMGLKADGSSTNATFNPTGVVSRAEFGTVFSRLMYGDIYNKTAHSSAPYYENHLKALQKDNIMKKIDQPENKEQRGFVMIMMMRADLEDKALTLTEQSEASNTIVKFFKNLF